MESLITKLTNELDTAMTQAWGEYIDLHKTLDTHRGKPIDDTNLPEVNRLLKDIQEKFADLYPAYHFIATRHEHVVNATNGYNEFIEALKKGGATQSEPEPTIIAG